METAIDLDTLARIFQYLTAAFGAFLAALWLGLVFWTYRDIRARAQDRLVHILASLLVAFLGPPGVIVYALLRPRRTLDEVYQHTLEEEALLTEIEDHSACPGCGTPTHREWQICPQCHTRLRKPCPRCDKLMELPWKLCPYCATPIPGVRAEAPSPNLEAALNR